MITGRRWVAPADRGRDAGRHLEGREGLRRQHSRARQDARTGRELRASPCRAARAKCYAEWTKDLKNYLYRDWKLTIWSCPELKAYSRPRETQRDFRLRLSQGSREQRDRAIAELAPSMPKRDRLQEKVREAPSGWSVSKPERASTSTWDAGTSIGGSALDFMLGRKAFTKTNVGRATSPPRLRAGPCSSVATSAGPVRPLRQGAGEIHRAGGRVPGAIEKMEANGSPEALKVQPIKLAPRKADITVEQVVLAWTPWKAIAGSAQEAAY